MLVFTLASIAILKYNHTKKIDMKILLKQFTNALTLLASLWLLVGLGYAVVKHQPIADFISEIAFCYLTIAVFNFVVFGAAILWHQQADK